ncbi:MAG: elongation factor P maturation arginine rhamnosyltransferase EarP [Xylophilus ampelinus]
MRWDIFCQVIDNYGDIGVCWRLAADLAARGESVRLWVDDAAALPWMAPGGAPGVEVRPWTVPLALDGVRPGEVLVEAFGCEIAPEFVALCVDAAPAGGPKPLWINLEYLTAEPYAQRCHGLPSPVLRGPAAGWTKWFYYPGFTTDSGGLLREAGLEARQSRFDRAAFRAACGAADGERLATLFCYEPPALGELLRRLRNGPAPTRLRVAPGRAAAAVRAALDADGCLPAASPSDDGEAAAQWRTGALSLHFAPACSQAEFDAPLWAADLNFVRGEDSLVRALWAGRPFVWQIYPQDDGAHAAKLEAFLDWLGAPDGLRAFHRAWNGLVPGPLPAWDLDAWGRTAREARSRLLAQSDLAARLIGFVAEKR